MKRRYSALILLAFILLIGAAGARADVTWGDSLETALKTARKTGKPILVDFYAEWCGWCKKLDSDVYTDSQVTKTADQFIRVKLDTDHNGRDAARQYSVSNLPTILVLNGKGEIEARFLGYSPAPAFNTRLAEAARTHKEFPVLLSRYRSNGSDLDAAFRLTQIYARRGDEEQAQRSLARVSKLDPSDTRGKYGKALNTVADMYASRRNFDEAVALFRRAVRTAQNPADIGYGQLSLAVCRFDQRDLDGARAELKTALANPKIRDKDKADARSMLAQLEELAKKRS